MVRLPLNDHPTLHGNELLAVLTAAVTFRRCQGMRNPIHFLRTVAIWEGISFLILLGIAMPLKYIWDMPIAVKIVGLLHGILFITFCIALARAKFAAKWSIGRTAIIFIAALLPFGPFIIDRRVKAWESGVGTTTD